MEFECLGGRDAVHEFIQTKSAIVYTREDSEIRELILMLHHQWFVCVIYIYVCQELYYRLQFILIREGGLCRLEGMQFITYPHS